MPFSPDLLPLPVSLLCSPSLPLSPSASDWGYLILLYLFVQLSRAVVVIVLFPGLALSGYGLSWKEAVILVWSGLRGAVALTLALTVSVRAGVTNGGTLGMRIRV